MLVLMTNIETQKTHTHRHTQKIKTPSPPAGRFLGLPRPPVPPSRPRTNRVGASEAGSRDSLVRQSCGSSLSQARRPANRPGEQTGRQEKEETPGRLPGETPEESTHATKRGKLRVSLGRCTHFGGLACLFWCATPNKLLGGRLPFWLLVLPQNGDHQQKTDPKHLGHKFPGGPWNFAGARGPRVEGCRGSNHQGAEIKGMAKKS